MQPLRAWECTLGVALACCSSERANAPTLGDCLGAECRPSTVGGSTSPRDASVVAVDASDAQAEAVSPPVTLALDVNITADTAFVTAQPYGGDVELHAHAETGELTTTGTTAVRRTTTMAVTPGADWFAVVDRQAAVQIAPTLQRADVTRATTSWSLRGVSWDALNTTFIDNQPWAPRTGSANVVVVFARAGAAVPGITVSAVATGALAYFQAESFYTTDGPTSAAGSTVLVRDIGPLPAYPTLSSLTLQYQLGSAVRLIPVRAAPNFVSWVVVEVP